MNTQVLHHLTHGDLITQPDVTRLTGNGAVFADGTQVDLDEVIPATGYEYRIPFLDEGLLGWRNGHPQLHLDVVSREVDSPSLLGFVEFADAAHQRLDEMAPGHTNHVERSTYVAYRARFRDRFGWHDVDDHTDDAILPRVPLSPSSAPSSVTATSRPARRETTHV